MRYILLLFTFSSLVSAETMWLDEDWQEVGSEEQASFYVKGPLVEQDGAWPTRVYYQGGETLRFKGTLNNPEPGNAKAVGDYEYYHSNGKLQSIGRRNDKGEFEGPTHFYNEEGVLISENNYFASQLHGTQKTFFANGQEDNVFQVFDGKRAGKCIHYYDTGELRQSHNLVDGVPEGEQLVYFPSGVLKERSFYVLGKKHGQQQYFHENGQLSYQSEYQAGKLNGAALSFNDTGHKYMEVNYLNGERHGAMLVWDKHGQLIEQYHYVNGKQEGEKTSYDSFGNIKQIDNYKNGRKVGARHRYYPGGQKLKEVSELDDKSRLIRRQLFDIDGNKTLEFTASYPNGKRIADEKHFKDGRLVKRDQKDQAKNWYLTERFDEAGELIERYETLDDKRHNLQLSNSSWGRLTIIESKNYRNGKLHGLYTRMSDGELIEKGRYSNDLKVGQWQYHDRYEESRRVENYNQAGQLDGELKETSDKGQLLRLANYRGGQLDGTYLEYSADGTLQAKGKYVRGERHGSWQYVENYYPSMFWFGEYKSGKQVGKWKAESEAGYELARTQYDDQGRAQGAFYYFSEEGLLKRIERYADGLRHGDTVEYLKGKPYRTESYEQDKYISSEKMKSSEISCLLFDC